MRNIAPSGESFSISNVLFKRDAAVFQFRSGTVTLFNDVNGKVTGAIFHGDGSVRITPPTAEEKHSIQLLTHSPQFEDDFDTVVFRFTDHTDEELKAAKSGPAPADSAAYNASKKINDLFRKDLHYNLPARLLEDVLSPKQGGFFLAAFRAKKVSREALYIFDPRGAVGTKPEEVQLRTVATEEDNVWLAFHREQEYRDNSASGTEENAPFAITHEDLDTSINKSGFLSGTATLDIEASSDGVVVLPLDLYPTLRVSKVVDSSGTTLQFVQENKDEDPDFAVILPSSLKKGQSYRLSITYAGKDTVLNEGGANYYPVPGARTSWYPSVSHSNRYATYHLKFRVPKGLELIATGQKLNEQAEGQQTVSEWDSPTQIPVAGFNLGKFKKEEAKLSNGFAVEAYANTEASDMVSSILHAAEGGAIPHQTGSHNTIPVGDLNTTGMLKRALAQAAISVNIYQTYYGELPFKSLAVTQQGACNFGQSWPMLVYLPICSFWDTTIQHELGLDGDPTYWKVVTPHEVAHQWWGQTVSFNSYRDQWMSEGFADMSSALFLQGTGKNNEEFLSFWRSERKLLTDKNAQGFRPIDVGSVTMGYRLSNARAGAYVYRDLVYPKGAYILHMLRMMMWSQKDGDKNFIAMMKDFIDSHKGRPASTEDFKAVVEKHMLPAMDLDGNHKMDWFFNEYVYGTALPTYSYQSTLKTSETGVDVHLKITQANVDSTFKMTVPIDLILADGRHIRAGRVGIPGNSSRELDFHLPPMPTPVKKVEISHFYDILALEGN